jgi:5-dehydro-4-deoxyglucarate dehydratase
LVRDLYIDVLLPINRIRKSRKGYAVSLIKAGMEIVGLPVGNTVRPPISHVEKEHYKALEQIIRSAFEKYPVDNKEVSH